MSRPLLGTVRLLAGADAVEMDRRCDGLFSEARGCASTAVKVGCMSGDMCVMGDEGVDTAKPIVDWTSESYTLFIAADCSLLNSK